MHVIGLSGLRDLKVRVERWIRRTPKRSSSLAMRWLSFDFGMARTGPPEQNRHDPERSSRGHSGLAQKLLIVTKIEL